MPCQLLKPSKASQQTLDLVKPTSEALITVGSSAHRSEGLDHPVRAKLRGIGSSKSGLGAGSTLCAKSNGSLMPGLSQMRQKTYFFLERRPLLLSVVSIVLVEPRLPVAANQQQELYHLKSKIIY